MDVGQRLFRALLIAIAATAAPAGFEAWAAAVPHAPTQGNAQREVLPAGVSPQHYDLALVPDIENFTFRATVDITVEVTKPTAAVTLNAVGLSFDRTSADDGPPAAVTLDPALGRATLAFAGTLLAGTHVLHIEYHGAIGHTTLGFFAMDYVGPDGPRRTLATNFEPAAARELLPCWDEPGRKAVFTVSIDAPKDRMALSNMPVERTISISDTMKRVRFERSPEMSTYLLFVAVGDFERLNAAVDGVDVGVVVKRGDGAKAAFALEQAGKILHYYNEYFGIAYPLPKLDLIAAPGQIEGGSMENWGAIFYSQNHLLFDPKSSTEEDRQTVFEVLAHEMAHQWFGDLVTMAWWDDLWLNEGFARWMQTYAADALHPEWETGLKAADITEYGKEADALPSTHPVVQQILTADQAGESFDSITYDKGAAIITMLNAYVGRDPFREGVRRYMREHAYGNTVDSDLWRTMQEAVGQPIVGIEQDFTRQQGLPLVAVARAPAGLHLVQSQFVDDTATLAALPRRHWRLPLEIGPAAGKSQYLLLQDSANVAQEPPVLVNKGQSGFARVLYAAGVFGPLAAGLPGLQPVDQLGLINDAVALGIARIAPAANLMELLAALPPDANPLVWMRVIDVLSAFDRRHTAAAQRDAFRRYALDLLAPLAGRLGTFDRADEPANLSILRAALMTALGDFGDASVILDARQRFERGEGSPTLQRTDLSIVASQADAATFDALLSRAAQTADPLDKQRLFGALARVFDPALARRMIDAVLSGQAPAGTSAGILTRLSLRHADLVWDMLAPRIDDPALPWSKNGRWSMIREVAAQSARANRIAELDAYVARSVPPDARRPFLESAASIRRNQRITTAVLPEIDRWIATHRPAAPSAAPGAPQP